MKELLKLRSVRILLPIMLATVLVIFIHSAMSPETSQNESDTVGEVVGTIVETVAPNKPTLKEYITKNIRKIAHFLEFGALGLEAFVLAFFIYRHKKRSLAEPDGRMSLGYYLNCAVRYFMFGLTVAFLDESLQLLSKRGPQIKDVWIDLAGYMSFGALILLIFLGVALIRSIKNKKSKKTA